MAHTDRQPSNEIFEDLKQGAIKVWNKYDDTYGYATEKKDKVNSITNYADNWYTFLGMMDSTNQSELLTYITQETLDFLREQHIHYGYVISVNFV